jgi:hypothetical protein
MFISKLIIKQIHLNLLKYCQASVVCVTNKTSFGFDDRIYWPFIQLVTVVHKSLYGTFIFFECTFSTSDHTSLIHYSVVLHSVFWLSLSLFLLLPLCSIGHPWNTLFHFSFLIARQSVGLLGRGISPSQGHYVHRTTQTQNKRKHPCLERDWNLRSQCSSERRQFVP